MSQGALRSIDFSFDLILFNGGSSNAVSYGGLIFQNSSYYIGGYDLTPLGRDLNRWQSGYSFNLNASNFGLLTGGGVLKIPIFHHRDLYLHLVIMRVMVLAAHKLTL